MCGDVWRRSAEFDAVERRCRRRRGRRLPRRSVRCSAVDEADARSRRHFPRQPHVDRRSSADPRWHLASRAPHPRPGPRRRARRRRRRRRGAAAARRARRVAADGRRRGGRRRQLDAAVRRRSSCSSASVRRARRSAPRSSTDAVPAATAAAGGGGDTWRVGLQQEQQYRRAAHESQEVRRRARTVTAPDFSSNLVVGSASELNGQGPYRQ